MRVAVLGCGYVGLELCRQLVAAGHDPVGVRRSADGIEAIEETGATAVRADVTDADNLAAVPDADAVVFAASSGGRDATAAREVYVEGQRTAIDHFASRVDRPDRYRLERYVDGPVTEGYLNTVHRDDAAGAVRYLLAEDAARGEVVLVVDDEPVEKWSFADWLAEQCGESTPDKRTVEERLAEDPSETVRRRLTTSKRCSNAKLRGLSYAFEFPTYREGYRPAVEAYRDS